MSNEFELVAITYSQPEAAVILSMLDAYGIPAYPLNQHHLAAAPTLAVALGGIRILAMREAADEARALLAEASDQAPPVLPRPLADTGVTNVLITLVFTLFAGPPPARIALSRY